MRKLTVFNFISLNGYYKGPNGDISWAMHDSKEENEFASENAQAGGILLFGRITYEMMKSYWPTPEALKNSPIVADGMNKAEKIVFSRTLKEADWNNTRIISDNIVEEIRKMKQTPGKSMTILGSGSIVSQFAEHDLVDGYQLMVHPVAIGEGTSLLNGISQKQNMKLTSTRTFRSGSVLLCYEPVKN